MFRLSNATGGYNKTVVVSDASLEVARGEIVALLGRNGSGKTTLMKYAMGLLEATSGSAELDDARLPASPSKRARLGLGYVPQGRYVFPRLTVTENIVASAAACGHPARAAAEEFYANFPALRTKANALAGTLSGGQQQILAIGRALAIQPKILLLDEPTEGVQPSIVDEIAGTLLRLNRELKLAILVAEQDLDFCLSIARRAYIMDRGTVVKEVASKDLIEDKALQHELLGV